ncbi:Protein deglycase DJ-1zDJ-1 [Blyttiomyces sp. JEL0837]|nr:Protein deglycase DJ-1zDJ-1 [Blyttiomyces sp. JEL0837]
MSTKTEHGSALLLITNGSEEMEAVITIDCLRRAGIEVTVAGVDSASPVECSRKVKIVPDIALKDVKTSSPFDVIILPGGMGGARAFEKSPVVHALLQEFYKNDKKIVAAICAAPIALKAAKIGQHRNITSHPSVKEELTSGGFKAYREDRVVVDGNLITSRGPGTAFDFAFAIIKALKGPKEVSHVAGGMVLPDGIVM